MTEAAESTRLIENERVRVTEWRFAPGAATGFHRHEYDYVVLPMTSGELLLKEPGGDRPVALAVGKPYYRGKGVEHDVVNGDDHEIVFIEVEIM